MEILLTNIKKSKTYLAYTQAWINQTFNRCKTPLTRPIITTTTITVSKCKLTLLITKAYRVSFTKRVWWIRHYGQITRSWIGRKWAWRARWSTRGRSCCNFKLNLNDRSNKMKKRFISWVRNCNMSWWNRRKDSMRYSVQVLPAAISPLEARCNNLKV